jgi:hypothetical protein
MIRIVSESAQIAGDQIDKPSIAYWRVHSAGASRKTNDRQDQIGSQWWAALPGMVGVLSGIFLFACGIVLLIFRHGFGFDITNSFRAFW